MIPSSLSFRKKIAKFVNVFFVLFLPLIFIATVRDRLATNLVCKTGES